MAELERTEYLYELWEANWDDGPLGNYQIRQHPITRKTAKRIYFVDGTGYSRHEGKAHYVDRQRIEADGEIWWRPRSARLYLREPEIPSRPKLPSLSELRQVMADAHPDRGGSDEAFIAARTRYEAARARAR